MYAAVGFRTIRRRIAKLWSFFRIWRANQRFFFVHVLELLSPTISPTMTYELLLSAFFLNFRAPRRRNSVTFDESFDVF